VLIEGETVSTIGARLDVEADLVIDAPGKLVIPAASTRTHTWSCRRRDAGFATLSDLRARGST
jgi:hypothetical protein